MSDRESSSPSRRTRVLREFAAILGGGIVAFALAARFDLFEFLRDRIVRFERFELDEMLVAAVALAFGLGMFSMLRWRDLRREMRAREETEEALREGESRYRALVEHIPAVFYTWDFTGRGPMRYVSPQIEALLGLTQEEWVRDPETWRRRLHPEDRDRVISEWERTDRTGEPFNMEYRLLATDGREVWVRDEAVVLQRGPDGRATLWQGFFLDVTARRLAEEQIRETEARYRSLVETVPAVTYVWDSAWEPGAAPAAYMSPQVFRLLGYTHEEWQADPGLWHARCHPEDRDRVLASWAETAAAGLPFSEEYRLLTKNGDIVWVRDDAVPVGEGPAGRPLYQGVMFDITERKSAEEALREAEARYRTLVETMPAAIYLEPVDESTNTLYMSPQIEAISGHPAQEWADYGELWPSILHPEDRDEVLGLNTRTIATGEPYRVEYRMIRPDGSVVWVRDEASLVRGEDGEPIYWQGFMLDITQRKVAEARVQEAEARYRTLVEQLPVVVYIDAVDDVSTALYMSPQYEALVGYTPQERTADPGLWVRLLHPDDRDSVLAESARTNETGDPFRMEYRLIAKDGRVVWVRDEAVLLRDEEGNPRFWQGVLLDVTERKLAEERLGRRDEILGAVGFAAERFLKEGAWEDGIGRVLERLGRASQASRVLVFENERDEDGSLLMTIRWEWTAQGIASIKGPSNHRAAYAEGLSRWEQVLGSGGVVSGITRDLPESERRALEDEAVLSHVTVPVFVGDEWWGFLGLDSCESEREWAQVEIDALRAAADTLGAAIGRDRSQRRLAEAETRFRTLVENIPAVTYVHAPAGADGVFWISPQVEAMIGYTPEEWTSAPDTWISALHPDDRERVLAEDRRTDETGEPFSIEYRQIAKDGRVVWVRDEAVLVHDQHGRPLFWQGVRLDITGRKEAEHQVREAEERYRTLVETVPAITYIDRIDEVASSVYISPQVKDVLGYTPEEWVARAEVWSEGLHPDDHERVFEALRAHNERGEPFRVEYRVRHHDGHWVWVRDEALVLRDDGGVSRFSQGVMFDISEQKAAEEELRETQQRFQVLVEHIPAVLYVELPDPDAPSIYIAPQIEQLFGVTAEEYVGHPELWLQLVHPDDREVAQARYEDALAAGVPWSSEYRVVRPDGSTVWVHDEASLLMDERGRPRLVQGVMFDITERRLAEQALRESEQREREAADRLRALDEMKNTFLAAVSHELRSPLTSILGLSLTLERHDALSPGDRADLLGRLATNARKLDRLLKDLLDIDRLNRGIVTLKERWTDVGALARRTVQSLDALAERNVIVEAEPVSVACDAPKVERIVENLLVNAARHTSEEARIWLRVRPHDGGALIVVDDEGPGVADELKQAIFEPFRQGPSHNPATPGTGIGLSLVGRFAELHGGRAWVQDREGGGASFRVFLPGKPMDGNGEVRVIGAEAAGR
jgi:PAS domain S-box-containing protein